MSLQVKKYQTSITIGLRFGPSFSLCDNFGEFADEMLYSEKYFFNKKVFPTVTSEPFSVRLLNPKTGDYLSLSQQDLILNCNFDDTIAKIDSELTPKLKSGSINEIHEDYQKILDRLRDYDLDRILRLGYVNRYVFDTRELTKLVTDKIIGNSIDGVSEMTLRFSKKYPVPEALSKKNINNYHNVIYTIGKKPDKDDLAVSLDYQEFYEPVLGSTKELRFDDFLSKMEHYNRDTFPEWLGNLGEK